MTRIFDIADFGACPDGKTLNTAAIQSAIDACCAAGGGTVLCGPGEHVLGSIELKSRVTLHLAAGCRLTGSTNLADYDDFIAPGFRHDAAPEKSTKHLIRAIGAEGFAITGPGEINGSGPSFYDTTSILWERFYAKPDAPRPRLLMAYKCRHFRLEDTAFNDSPCWTFWLMQCQGVRIHRISMHGDPKMINNDGIDLDMCRDVTVSDCVLQTGDDCVILRAMHRLSDTSQPCENITVSNCVLDSQCQGIRIGCPGDGVIRNCAFSNLVITGRGNGIVFNNPRRYLPTNRPGSADIRNILFSNVAIDCENAPISLDVEDGVALPYLGDITFANFRITSGKPIRVLGNPETIIRNVRFSAITITTTGDDAILCRHCQGIVLDGVELNHRGRGPEAGKPGNG